MAGNFETNITVNLKTKAEQYNAGMAQAAKTTEGLKKAAQEASKELDHMEKEAEQASKAIKKLDDENKKVRRTRSAGMAGDEYKKVKKDAEEAAKAQAILGGAIVDTSRGFVQSRIEVVKLKGAMADLSRETVRYKNARAAITGQGRTNSGFIQHSGREISYTAEEIRRYGAAARSSVGQVVPFDQANSRTARTLATLRTLARDTGTAFNTQLVPAVRNAVGPLRQITQEALNAPIALRGVGTALGGVAIAGVGLGVVGAAIGAFGLKAVQAKEDINQLRGSLAAIFAANEKVEGPDGKLLEGVEKIKAVQIQVSGLFKQIQIEAIKSADTTQGLIDKMSIAAAPGFAAGMNPDQILKLTVAMSNAMSVLRLPNQQAVSEIRELLSGDQLENSTLARALGLKNKEQWSELAKGGKLYENLMERMKDFNAAAELNAGSLTRTVSALDELRQKFYEIAGDKPTEVLTKGLNEVLRMVQNVDGSLTPLGKSFQSLAEISGFFVGKMAQDFIWLAKKIVEAGDQAAGVARVMQHAMVTGEVTNKRGAAVDALNNTQIQVNGESMSVSEAINRRNNLRTTRGLFAKNGVSAYDSDLAAFEAATKPYAWRLEQLDSPTYVQDETDAATRDLFGNGRSAAQAKSKNKIIPAPRTGSGSKGDKKRDPRIAATVAEMRREIQLSDSRELGLNGQIAIYDKYIPKLKKLKDAQKEVADTENDRAVAVNNLGKKLKELAEKRKADDIAINAVREASQLKLADAFAARELEQNKSAYALEEEALQNRYDAGLISTKQFYEEKTRIQSKALSEEIENERESLERRLENVRNNQNKEFQKPLAKAWRDRKATDRDPVKLEEFDAEIAEISDQITGLKRSAPRQLGAIVFQNAGQMVRATRDSTKDGISQALDIAFQGANLPIADGVKAGFVKGIQDALKGTDIGKSLDAFFGANGGGDFAMGAAQMLMAAIGGSVQNARNLDGYSRSTSLTSARNQAGPSFNRDLAYRELEESLIGKSAQFDTDTLGMFEGVTNFFNGLGAWQSPEIARRNAKGSFIQGERQKGENDINAQEIDALIGKINAAASTFQGAMGRQVSFMGVDEAEALSWYLGQLEALPQKTEEVYWEIESIKKRIYDKTLSDMVAKTQRDTQRIAESWEGAAARMADGLRKFREEQDRALDSVALQKQVQNIYGIGSASENNLAAIDAKIKANQERLIEIGRANNSTGAFNGSTLLEFKKFTGTNQTGSEYRDSQGNTFGNGASKTFETDAKSFVEDIAQIQEWLRAGLSVTNSNGQSFTAKSIPLLESIKGRFAEGQGMIDNQNREADEIGRLIEDLKASKEIPTAEIRQGSKDTARSLGFELEGIRAGLSTSKEDDKALAYRQIDEDIKRREKEFENAGFLGSKADKESSRAIRSSLEEMRSLMKQQVDRDIYTDSNPMPVRVVESKPLFANPESFYFREKTVALSIAAGAISINGGQGSETQVAQRVIDAIRGEIPALNRELNRDSNLSNNRVTT